MAFTAYILLGALFAEHMLRHTEKEPSFAEIAVWILLYPLIIPWSIILTFRNRR